MEEELAQIPADVKQSSYCCFVDLVDSIFSPRYQQQQYDGATSGWTTNQYIKAKTIATLHRTIPSIVTPVTPSLHGHRLRCRNTTSGNTAIYYQPLTLLIQPQQHLDPHRFKYSCGNGGVHWRFLRNLGCTKRFFVTAATAVLITAAGSGGTHSLRPFSTELHGSHEQYIQRFNSRIIYNLHP